jgi:hypothetical protein
MRASPAVAAVNKDLPETLGPRQARLRIGARQGGRSAGSAARQAARPDQTREDSVSEFGDLEKKAQDYVEEHPDQADKGINEAAGFAERETDHQHDQQIDRAVDAAEQHLGQNQDQSQQGNQDDQNQQGSQN